MSDSRAVTSVQYASTSGERTASVGRRIGAFVFDLMLFVIVYIAAVYASTVVPVPELIIVLVVVAAWVVGYTAMQGGTGTLGMRLLGLRLVLVPAPMPLPVHPDGRPGDRPGFWVAGLRNVLFWFSCLIVVGPFSPLFDRSGLLQGWHDRVSKTRMVAAGAAAADDAADDAAGVRAGVADDARPGVGAHTDPALESYTLPSLHSFEHLRSEADDIEATRLAAPRVTTFALVLADGTSRRLAGASLVGRNPTEAAGDRVDALIAVDDPTTSMSKTHALLESRLGRLYITDRHSTNGSQVLVAGALPVTVPPGETHEVPIGASLQFGDYVARVVLS